VLRFGAAAGIASRVFQDLEAQRRESETRSAAAKDLPEHFLLVRIGDERDKVQ
jgi:hypothetical protein